MGKRIRTCALYGFTEIARVLLEWAKKYKLSVEFIVENHAPSNNRIGDIPLFQRNYPISMYPRVDAIIVCDLRKNEVKAKLESSDVNSMVYTYDEIIDGSIK